MPNFVNIDQYSLWPSNYLLKESTKDDLEPDDLTEGMTESIGEVDKFACYKP